ncbi:hypothetical protein GH714_036040 [Hevea brasiliensis]|uniref:Protein kinase domain-containing protein n=1 Tax=Hevea brasiliensis TaxID=3981 RepID=A0A6A6KMV3_HEVBR|nr:hypothetical protein GH714_036040 [Hevea brasiliensis]
MYGQETGDHFACKSISKKKLRTAVDIEDVRREVQIMRHLPKHPNIVSLKDTYEDDNAVHLVMELCEGGELLIGLWLEGITLRELLLLLQRPLWRLFRDLGSIHKFN